MKDDLEQFEEFSDEVKRSLVNGIKEDPTGYAQLIEKVAEIDKEAAVYMRFVAPTLRDFIYHRKLMHAFPWHRTPQGSEYWADILTRLDGELADDFSDITIGNTFGET